MLITIVIQANTIPYHALLPKNISLLCTLYHVKPWDIAGRHTIQNMSGEKILLLFSISFGVVQLENDSSMVLPYLAKMHREEMVGVS